MHSRAAGALPSILILNNSQSNQRPARRPGSGLFIIAVESKWDDYCSNNASRFTNSPTLKNCCSSLKIIWGDEAKKIETIPHIHTSTLTKSVLSLSPLFNSFPHCRILTRTCPCAPPWRSAGRWTHTARPGWRSSAGAQGTSSAPPPAMPTTVTRSMTGTSSIRWG